MDYAVAIDVEGDVYDSTYSFDLHPPLTLADYMTKNHVNGIPHAFVLDKDGRVAWHGHPMEPQFEQTIQQAAQALATAAHVPEPVPVPQSRHELEGMGVGQLKKILGYVASHIAIRHLFKAPR
jgi:hypothetical protein